MQRRAKLNIAGGFTVASLVLGVTATTTPHGVTSSLATWLDGAGLSSLSRLVSSPNADKWVIWVALGLFAVAILIVVSEYLKAPASAVQRRLAVWLRNVIG